MANNCEIMWDGTAGQPRRRASAHSRNAQQLLHLKSYPVDVARQARGLGCALELSGMRTTIVLAIANLLFVPGLAAIPAATAEEPTCMSNDIRPKFHVSASGPY